MDITHNQLKTQTLEASGPAKVSVVSTAEKSNLTQIPSLSNASPAVENETAQTAIYETTAEKQQEKAENLHKAVSQMNDHVQNLQRNLQFSVDEVTGKDVVTVIDKVSEEVIRQIPTEEALALAQRLAENREDRVQLFSTLA